MKCKNCGSEWHSAGNIQKCPFCAQDCTLPLRDVEVLFAIAEGIPDTQLPEKAEAYRRAAEYGYAPAQYQLGRCYEFGDGVELSPSRATVYYRLAAEQGHAEAAYHLAFCLRERYLGMPEADRAYFWLRIAAELGVAGARRMVGDCYSTGEGIPENPIRAAYWYTLASEDGDFEAAYSLAKLYHEGRGVRKNPAFEKYYAEIAYNGGIRAADRMIGQLGGHVFSEVPPQMDVKYRNEERFELGYRAYAEGKYTVAALMYSLAAKDGYAHAQNNLGVCCEKGQGVPQDEAAAAVWYGLAARGGYDTAWLNLGDCYRYGRGVEKDEARAFECYLTAAENGHARAQFIVAGCYFNAQMVDRDIQAAMDWYKKSATQGYGEAIKKVNAIRGDMTELYNHGVEAYEKGNYEDALKYYEIAAECGHPGAQCNLGYCYQNGKGCDVDMRRAVRYYKMAAEQGNGTAELNLAVCHLRGEGGLSYDYAKANEYLARAKKRGVSRADEIIAENTARRRKKVGQRVYAASCAVLSRGEEGDTVLSLQFRRLAAGLGNARAMSALGCHYEFGYGVPLNEETATMWYARAEAAGYTTHSRMKSAILKQMRRPPAGFRRPSPIEENRRMADAVQNEEAAEA
ncbi:MAG: SEL1-like repeat protein [Clostridia bacterium]|nr:SEL1-like repeat protein [Clostridia bacterium]